MAEVGPALVGTSAYSDSDTRVEVGVHGEAHGWSIYTREGEYYVMLPHSCDEWLIGSGTADDAVAGAERMIEALQAAIEWVCSHPGPTGRAE